MIKKLWYWFFGPLVSTTGIQRSERSLNTGTRFQVIGRTETASSHGKYTRHASVRSARSFSNTGNDRMNNIVVSKLEWFGIAVFCILTSGAIFEGFAYLYNHVEVNWVSDAEPNQDR